MIILEIFQYAKCDLKCIPKVTDWNLTTKKAEKKERDQKREEDRKEERRRQKRREEKEVFDRVEEERKRKN